MNEQTYRNDPAANWSTFKIIGQKSPRHYRYAIDNPTPSTASQVAGQLTHCLALTPDLFGEDFYVYDGRRDKRQKAYQAAIEEAAGRTIVKSSEVAASQAIADAVAFCPVASRFLSHSRAVFEQSHKWTHRNGIEVKGRFDIVIPGVRVEYEDGDLVLVDDPDCVTVADLKGTRSSDPRAFARDAANMEYHAQLAHYGEGARDLYAVTRSSLVLIGVEIAAPHDTIVTLLDEDTVWAGNVKRMTYLKTLADCREANEWPGRNPTGCTLDLPAWAMPDDGEESVTIIQED